MRILAAALALFLAGPNRCWGLVDLVPKGVRILERSDVCVLRLTGQDRLRFLNNQLSNRFDDRRPGDVVDGAMLDARGRVLDVATAVMHPAAEETIVLGSGCEDGKLAARMNGFVFALDKVEISDLSVESSVICLFGEGADEVLRDAGAPVPTDAARCVHWENSDSGAEERGVLVVKGTGLSRPGEDLRLGATGLGGEGYTLVLDRAKAVVTSVQLTKAGGRYVQPGDAWRTWRSMQLASGRPAVGGELGGELLGALPLPSKGGDGDEDGDADGDADGAGGEGSSVASAAGLSSMEAGLWHCLHLSKGCYLGQESVGRVASQGDKAVRRQIVGVRIPPEGPKPIPGEKLLWGADERVGGPPGVGTLTSMDEQPVALDGEHTILGLGVVRLVALDGMGGLAEVLSTRPAVRGAESGAVLTLVDVPYPSRLIAQAAAPPVGPGEKDTAPGPALGGGGGGGGGAPEDQGDASSRSEAAAAEAKRKEEKLKAMQARLDAFKKRQSGEAAAPQAQEAPAEGAPSAGDEEAAAKAEAERKEKKLEVMRQALEAFKKRKQAEQAGDRADECPDF